MSNIAIIIGSTREGRFADIPARWIEHALRQRPGVTARLLDLRDFPMPFFEEALSPARLGPEGYQNEVVRRWTAEIAASDAFIIVTPEYNHGYPAVLKNALDYVYKEWNRKPVAFVSYGALSGARAVQQLKEVAIELQMAPIRNNVSIPVQSLMAFYQGGDVESTLVALDDSANAMIDDLLWWTDALAADRPVLATAAD